MIRFRSIISRIVAFHVAAIGVTAVLLPLALYYLLNQAANSLHSDALRSQALTIASYLTPRPDGSITLDIPPEVKPLYTHDYGLYAYAVLDTDGRVLFSSRSDGEALFPLNDQSVRDWYIRHRRTGVVLFGDGREIRLARQVDEIGCPALLVTANDEIDYTNLLTVMRVPAESNRIARGILDILPAQLLAAELSDAAGLTDAKFRYPQTDTKLTG